MQVKDRWLRCVSLAAQHTNFTKEMLGRRRIYQQGAKRLRKLLRDIGPLLPPAGPAVCTWLHRCAADSQVSTRRSYFCPDIDKLQ